jgi:putative hydrolase of the HAD superfamily
VNQDLPDIGAVIFDFGGVLCAHPEDARMAEIAHFLKADPAEFHTIFWQHRIPYDAGMDEAEYWSTIVDQLGLEWDPRHLSTLVKYEVELWSQFDQRTLGFAAHLQARGYGTGILSNLPRPLGEALRAHPSFLHPFDHQTFSYELGVVKPAEAIYRHSLQGLGVTPEQALFLDDRPGNIEGARAIGVQAELYLGWEDMSENIAPRYGLPLPEVARRQ